MKEDIKEDVKEEIKEEIKEDIQEDIQEDIKEKGASKVEKLTKLNRQATHVELEDTELSPDTQNAESTLDPEVLTNAQNTNLFEYEQAHLDSRHHGILKGFKAMTPDEIIQWQNELITKPLLRLPSSLEEISIQLFKNLVSYMGDRKSSKNPHLHIVKHTRLAMGSPEEVKDEAYMQVIKQITRNPNPESAEKGWKMFSIMASCYPPSLELYYALIHYLLDIIKTGDEDLQKRANYILIRLNKTFESRRKLSPSDDEIRHVEEMKPISIEMHFFSGAATSIQVESYTTIRELKTQVMSKLSLNISRIPFYSIFEMCYKKDCIEERYIDEFDKVCDILSVWQRETDNYKKEKSKEKEEDSKIEFKFFLKLLLYYDFNPEDVDAVTMTYVQCNFDVINDRYNLSEEDIIKLGAIQLYVNYSDLEQEEILKNLNDHIKDYITKKIITNNTQEFWVDKIMTRFNENKFKTSLEAKNEYLNILKNNELYKSNQFMCTYNSKLNTANNNSENIPNPSHIPEECIVAVKPNELIITDMERNKIYNIPLTLLASWGVNSELFVIVEKKSEKEWSKSYFNCNQSKLFKIILDTYTNILVGKNMVEIMTERLETCKMFESLPAALLKPGESLRIRQSTIYMNS